MHPGFLGPQYYQLQHRALDYVGEGLKWIERSREPGADFQQCMREARACAKLSNLCSKLARGEA